MGKLSGFETASGGVMAVLAGISTFLWGAADGWLVAFIALVILDYVTGVLTAILEGKLSSKVGLLGIIKKLLLFVVVALANIIDNAMEAGGTIRAIVLGFMVANEGISILENSARAGVPWPDKLLAILKQLKDDGEGGAGGGGTGKGA